MVRFLHYVLKVGNRAENLRFLTEVMGMKILRHEEFSEGCAATCNGPYSNRWSKTMVGYGPEDENFVLEITYNYSKRSYIHGNDFEAFLVRLDSLEGSKTMPEQYRFLIKREVFSENGFDKVILNVSDLEKTVAFWNGVLGMPILEEKDRIVEFKCGTDRTSLKMCECGGGRKINREEAYGRLAFSCTASEQEQFAKKIAEAGYRILTPLTDLETPGKATVRVLIVADPDGHEVCLVEDSGFRKLSRFDPEAEAYLQKMIAKYPD